MVYVLPCASVIWTGPAACWSPRYGTELSSKSIKLPRVFLRCARFALNTARYDLPADYYNTYLEKLAAVSANDIVEMAKKYITPDNAHILVVGNKSDVKDKLAIFAPDGKVNSYDVYGNEVKDLGMEIPAGMTAAKVLEDYINAIGGKKKVSAVKSTKTVMTGDTQMGQMMMTTVTVAPDRFAMMIGASGMTIQLILVDGNKGKMNGMGGSRDISREEIEDYKDQATPFIETKYAEMGYNRATRHRKPKWNALLCPYHYRPKRTGKNGVFRGL